MFLKFLSKYSDFGLLIIRVGLGGMFMFHGMPKITGGPDKWVKIGSAIKYVGIDFFPVFWGFMAAFSEFFGGIFLILGLYFRPVCILLTITMAVAANMHLTKGEGLLRASHAIENCIVFLSLIFVGPGKYSIDKG